jgi:hypothetical protein
LGSAPVKALSSMQIRLYRGKHSPRQHFPAEHGHAKLHHLCFEPSRWSVVQLLPPSITSHFFLVDSTETWTGDFTVGETLTESHFSAVTNQPKLPVTVLPGSDAGNQHFQMLLDADGFIGPDGQPIAVTSAVSGTKKAPIHCRRRHWVLPTPSSKASVLGWLVLGRI